ncbi:MAG: 2-dehydropantoate 2-reductase [Myxococcota bacterium]
MRMGIMGAGAIGSYVGGLLVHAGYVVTFVGRSSLGEELSEHGLHLIAVDGTERHVAAVSWATEPEALADCDVVLVAVKGLAIDEVGARLASLLRPDAVVLALQNGVSSAEALRRHLAPRAVWACSVGFNVLRRGEGRFLQATSAPLSTHHDVPAPIVEAFAASGLGVERHADMRAVLWGKLLLNLNNAINALADVPLLDQFRDRGMRRVMAAAIAEGLACLRAADIRPVNYLPVPPWMLVVILRMPTWLFLRIARRMVDIDPEARSSMWDDLQRGRRTEIHLLNGEVVALGERVGVPTPVNRAIVDAIVAAEQGAPRPPLVAGLVRLA